MPLEFAGPATPLDDNSIARAANKLGCEIAAVRAVIDVESRGGFLPDKRPKILFERHYFSKLTGGRYDASHPAISNPAWGGYGQGGAHQYDRLGEALALNRDAALRSASWGAFQIMGDNFSIAGYADAASFVAAMASGEPAQLDAFVAFVKRKKLDDELARHDWAGFARAYNGAAYRDNRYDEKLAAAYALHHAGSPSVETPHPTLRMGDTGQSVKDLQALLGIGADGDFGPNTKAAVVKFQRARGLFPDGIVGRGTWAALGG